MLSVFSFSQVFHRCVICCYLLTFSQCVIKSVIAWNSKVTVFFVGVLIVCCNQPTNPTHIFFDRRQYFWNRVKQHFGTKPRESDGYAYCNKTNKNTKTDTYIQNRGESNQFLEIKTIKKNSKCVFLSKRFSSKQKNCSHLEIRYH